MPEQTAALKKACKSLRAGDVVTIHFGHRDDEPFTVELTEVDDRSTEFASIGNGQYVQQMPLLKWKSRGDIDTLHAGTEHAVVSPFASAAHVSEIVSKAPYTIDKNRVRNSLYSERQRTKKRDIEDNRNNIDVDYSGYHYAGPLYVSYGLSDTVKRILSDDPSLEIEYGLNAERLAIEWKKAGYPGLAGGYKWSRDGGYILPHYPHDQYEDGAISLSDVVHLLLHRPNLKAWALRNYYRFKRTKKDAMNDGRYWADEQRKSWEQDMDYDFRKEFNQEVIEDDTFERHLEDTFDFES